jgi:hypothetical protein
MKHYILVSYWQQFATCPYHKPDICSPPLNPIFKSILKHRAYQLAPFLQVFLEHSVFVYIPPICATCAIHLLLLLLLPLLPNNAWRGLKIINRSIVNSFRTLKIAYQWPLDYSGEAGSYSRVTWKLWTHYHFPDVSPLDCILTRFTSVTTLIY